MSKEPILLSAGNVKDYLAGHGLWPSGLPMSVRELGGGVSNTVLLVEGKGPGGEDRRWVVKQSLEKLRVQDDWRSERSRIFREAEAIQALSPALGPETVPQIVHVGHDDYLFVMTAAPAGSATWKEALLEGQVNMGVARQAGKLLARMITASRDDPSFRTAFADRTVFDQLRIDPYYRTTAARHPDVRLFIQRLIDESWQIRNSLVHGDFSPKNMLVQDTHVFLIDFEVVHWGDPAFDAGFLLNHLFLKAFHQPQFAGPYFWAAREFWGELVREAAGAALVDFERMTMRHLGALMLARIDGKSPIEYIRDETTKEHARRFSKWLMLEGIHSFEDAMSAAGKALEVLNRENRN
jgi:5-methylthioribose kinase